MVKPLYIAGADDGPEAATAIRPMISTAKCMAGAYRSGKGNQACQALAALTDPDVRTRREPCDLSCLIGIGKMGSPTSGGAPCERHCWLPSLPLA